MKNKGETHRYTAQNEPPNVSKQAPHHVKTNEEKAIKNSDENLSLSNVLGYCMQRAWGKEAKTASVRDVKHDDIRQGTVSKCKY